ncbi:hypothetical protein KUV41_19455 [Halomonas sp. DP8Y7-1]|uniref:hypothetical protein n=1 Tax=Halomonas sp. DP8Y7-1 TaxID=2859078 RepID=UPI001C98BE39|nr:hypothetical protein [Halomonas sp. DP8Y7-1]MBY6031541.1 hypothetical protein [Halomonas sp. DP8Y7-1]
MFKPLLICFTALFAQLALLHWVDVRTSQAPPAATPVATVTTVTTRDDDLSEKSDEKATDTHDA